MADTTAYIIDEIVCFISGLGLGISIMSALIARKRLTSY